MRGGWTSPSGAGGAARHEDAIRREKLLKTWKRAWKIELIEAATRNGAIFGKISSTEKEVRFQLSLE